MFTKDSWKKVADIEDNNKIYRIYSKITLEDLLFVLVDAETETNIISSCTIHRFIDNDIDNIPKIIINNVGSPKDIAYFELRNMKTKEEYKTSDAAISFIGLVLAPIFDKENSYIFTYSKGVLIHCKDQYIL